MGEVFDAAFQRRFVDLEDTSAITKGLDEAIERHRRRAEVPRLEAATPGADEIERLDALCRAVDLSPDTLRETLDVALGLGAAGSCLEGPDARGRFRLRHPIPPAWVETVDETLRLPTRGGAPGPLRSVVFDPSRFIRTDTGRPVFRPDKDSVLLHLSHPLFKQALATFAQTRFAGAGGSWLASRWTARTGAVPAGADALLLLTVEEMGVNELREPFHHWVRTLRVPVNDGRLGEPLPWVAAAEDRSAGSPNGETVERARRVWDDVAADVRPLLERTAAALTAEIARELEAQGSEALAAERERFKARVAEVREAMNRTTLARLERERDRLLADMRTMFLFADLAREKELEIQNLEGELERRQHRYRELIAQLEVEQKRVLDRVLPRRFALRGTVQIFPVAVEIRVPETAR
jgi:hypothetical protein